MEPRQRLACNLTCESEAYGYTLTIWGGGAVLLTRFGTPTLPEIFAYVGGAVLGFALLALFAFEALFSGVDESSDQTLVVTSMVHVLATLGNLLVTTLVVVAGQGVGLPAVGVFLLVGVLATVVYNVLLLVEERTARLAATVLPTDNDVGT